MTLLDNHKVIERNVTLLLVLSLLVVCVGGIGVLQQFITSKKKD